MIRDLQAFQSNSLRIAANVFSRFGLDIILLFFSGLFFFLFLLGSLQIDKMSGIGNQVGTMTSGAAERKLNGQQSFLAIYPKTTLHNMDTVWVGRKSRATIEMESGQMLNLGELTLVILKQHFKPVLRKGMTLATDFEVVKGKVVVNDKTSFTGDAGADEGFDPGGLSEKKPSDPSSTNGQFEIYPLENSVIYSRSVSDVELTFVWPKALTGILAIRDRANGQMYYTSIVNQRSATVKIPQNSEFFWQILNANDVGEIGPFQFELKRLENEEAVKEIFKNQTTKKPIQVYW